MHRSGTSLTAELFQECGVNLGTNLVKAGRFNKRGYFEDEDVKRFHEKVLEQAGLVKEGWDFLPANFDFSPLKKEAQELAEKHMDSQLWGWKDPRTVLFLDLWNQVLDDPKYVFVYRAPWQVADSLFRRGDEYFAKEPEKALAVWKNYNDAILAFARKNEKSCVIVPLDAIVLDRISVIKHCSLHWNIELNDSKGAGVIEPKLLGNQALHREISMRMAFPEEMKTYDALNAANPFPKKVTENIGAKRSVAIDWQLASAANSRLVDEKENWNNQMADRQRFLDEQENYIRDLKEQLNVVHESRWWKMRERILALKASRK